MKTAEEQQKKVAAIVKDSAHCVWEDEGNHAKLWDPHEQLEPRSTKSLIQAGVGAILNARRIFPATIAAVSIMIAIALFGTVKFQSAITLGLIFLFTRGKLASETGTSVLVHCEMGVSRSATVCISHAVP
jgi:hypothetical protein